MFSVVAIRAVSYTAGICAVTAPCGGLAAATHVLQKQADIITWIDREHSDPRHVRVGWNVDRASEVVVGDEVYSRSNWSPMRFGRKVVAWARP
ncbi:MAG: hypothetical protein QOF74_1944 [Caballeronia mineralivorans]|nr:hypothetical protein [Caballeronia mineralivorans]